MFVGNVLSSFVLFSLKILEVPHQPRCTHPKYANNVQDSILTPMRPCLNTKKCRHLHEGSCGTICLATSGTICLTTSYLIVSLPCCFSLIFKILMLLFIFHGE